MFHLDCNLPVEFMVIRHYYDRPVLLLEVTWIVLQAKLIRIIWLYFMALKEGLLKLSMTFFVK